MNEATRPSPRRPRHWRPIPGLSLSLGITLFWIGLVVLIPLAALVLMSLRLDPETFFAAVTSERALAAYGLSFGASLVAALFNLGFGLLLAWILVRYRFPGRGLLDALIDLPLALPTAVAGIALTATFAPTGPIGSLLADFGIKGAYSALGVVIALVFIGIPFVVRAVQPVLADLQPELEEAAATLGATRRQTFWRVLLPALRPALVTGFALAFARGLGEYGSVVFISGNLPGKTEIVPFLIMTKLEQYEYSQAAAIAVVMLLASVVILFVLNRMEKARRRPRPVEVPA
jgi:sulfate/thiosulfate transport system permease protein